MPTLVISGGSSGIGKATATLFAERGWRVFELSRHGVSKDGITHVDCDVTSEESTRQAIDEVLKQTKTIDVVISNAGFGISGAVEFTAIRDAQKQMDVNFMGAVRLTQAVLPQLRQQYQFGSRCAGRTVSIVLLREQSRYQRACAGAGE